MNLLSSINNTVIIPNIKIKNVFNLYCHIHILSKLEIFLFLVPMNDFFLFKPNYFFRGLLHQYLLIFNNK